MTRVLVGELLVIVVALLLLLSLLIRIVPSVRPSTPSVMFSTTLIPHCVLHFASCTAGKLLYSWQIVAYPDPVADRVRVGIQHHGTPPLRIRRPVWFESKRPEFNRMNQIYSSQVGSGNKSKRHRPRSTRQ